MNYEFIEKLVSDAKIGDLNAKETLIIEFTPFINSISRKFFIHGYERCDIKNNLNILVTRIVKRNNFDGLFSLSDDIDNTVSLNHLMEQENNFLIYSFV